ncbi:MAG: glycosyltransferase family 39 protein [Deltaproteobacteria bacterium]|nr:glycosyltransferase family 39 protein [Deltaproteobacteria bacterium]
MNSRPSTKFSGRWPFLAALGILISALILLCFTPPVSRDALTHHLLVPKLYLKHGGFHEIPSIEFSYYPMNLEMLYLVPMYFGSDIVPKYIHLAFGLLTSLLIFGYLKKRLGSIYPYFGALFFLSIPIVVKLAITAYVDLGLAFFTTASLFLLFRWVEHSFRLRDLFFSAIMCGLALGTKYNGLIAFLLLTLSTAILYERGHGKAGRHPLGAVTSAALFVFTALVIFSPWMIRDLIWTNNPIYPLFDHLFNSSRENGGTFLNEFTIRTYLYKEKWWEIALIPIRMFFQGQDGNPRLFDGKLNPFLLILPILAFAAPGTDKEEVKVEKGILALFSALFFVFAYFGGGMRIRYIVPALPALAVLSTFGLARFTKWVERHLGKGRLFPQLIPSLLTLLVFFPNARYLHAQFLYVRPLDYMSGRVTRDAYIERYRHEYPAMQYINGSLPGGSKVLFVFVGKRVYFCDRDYVLDMEGTQSFLQDLAAESRGGKGVLSGLEAEGITHLLVNHLIFEKWLNYSLNQEERNIILNFINHYTKLLFKNKEYIVLKLIDPEK